MKPRERACSNCVLFNRQPQANEPVCAHTHRNPEPDDVCPDHWTRTEFQKDERELAAFDRLGCHWMGLEALAANLIARRAIFRITTKDTHEN
jgi:hypothetical protein